MQAIQLSTEMIINCARFVNNFKAVQAHIGPETPIIAVVKSNGYGYGLHEMAANAEKVGACSVGVGEAKDAIALREQGFMSPIVMLYPSTMEQIDSLLLQDVAVTVGSLTYLHAVVSAATRLGVDASVHIQIETGMHHHGLPINDITEACRILAGNKVVHLSGVATHFAATNDTALSEAQKQLFLQALSVFQNNNTYPHMIHVANSAVIDTHPELYSRDFFASVMPDVVVGVRCGSLLYGTYAWANAETIKTHPILESLKTQIIDVKTVLRGETIGYFNQFQAPKDCRIAILPLGWGSGFFPAPTRGRVLIGGKKANVVGPIGANICAIDVSDAPAEIGDEVVIIGTQLDSSITLSDVATQHETFVSRQVALFTDVPKRYIC